MTKIQKALKALEKVEHPEYGITKFRGLSLSRSDCDTIRMYCNLLEDNHGRLPYGWSKPYGEVGKFFGLMKLL